MPKIAAKDSNKNVTIAPHGTGKVVVGTGAADATVQSDGNHNLILQTGNSTTSKIEITDGANGDVAVTPNGTGNLTIDNIAISDNAIISTDTNGNIDITPNGTGEVNISKVDIDSGAIDGTTIANSDVTVGSGKTLDVSAGTLTTSTTQKQAIVDGAEIEGTDILSTGESGTTKFLRENGDGTCSWQTASGSDSLPSQTGNADKLLTTNGTAASWTNTPINLVKLAFSGQSSAPGAPSAGTVYYNSTTNILYVYNGTDWAVLNSPQYVEATGPDGAAGTEDGDYKYHVFNATKTGSAGFVVSDAGNSQGSNTLEYLIIGGGGSGRTATTSSGWGRGGGGAGGYRTATDMACPAVGNHNVTVGNGGSTSSATNGGDSVFNGITATGGGKGGGDDIDGSDGGSGGGGGNGASNRDGGSGNTPSTTPSQGNDGGNSTGTTGAGGGGGGASEDGDPATGDTTGLGGSGGDGTASSITGSSVTRGGGGGGCGDDVTSGGSGGGGASTEIYSTSAATAGTPNTGGGGGGGSYNAFGDGADGGSGVVIIRYKYK